MRQVFTSPRIENVEGVAKLLEDAGIEARITNGRSYRGAIRGNFSYRDSERTGPQPAVWIVKSDDQPRARELLRDRGLLDSTRLPNDSFLLPTMHARSDETSDPARKRAFRLKAGLLVLIAAALGLGFLGLRKPAPPASTAATQATPTAALNLPPMYKVAMPPALAETLLRIELAAHAQPGTCVSIEGADLPADMLQRLQSPQAPVRQASTCKTGNPALALDVREYRTDGSGVGTVLLDINGGKQRETRTLEVERIRDDWRVLRML